MKNLAMKTIIAVFSFIFTFAIAMVALTPAVFAGPPGQSVNALQVSGLGNQLGKNITAFYAIGRGGLIATQRDQMTLRVVKWTKTLPIQGDSVTFPATPVLSWNGNQMPYNLVVFAIHNDGQLTWVNADGSRPEGSGNGPAAQPLYVDSLKNSQIDEMKKSMGDGTLSYQFNFGN